MGKAVKTGHSCAAVTGDNPLVCRPLRPAREQPIGLKPVKVWGKAVHAMHDHKPGVRTSTCKSSLPPHRVMVRGLNFIAK